ncbi:MAG: membrane integrity-associated transporter subunit PqiC [Mailhella sp.]|nr:membrane integrity-associated transporter subunit PqiC [Mailhella sp.]
MKLFPLALILLLLSGCSMPSISTETPPLRYYVLPSPALSGTAVSKDRIAIMPVHLPGYLTRVQLVTGEGSAGITVHEYDRWGEELGTGIARVLSDAFAQNGISALPLRQGTLSAKKLQLDIRRFDGKPGGSVTLDTVWTVQNMGEIIKTGRVQLSCPAGEDLQSMVCALSELIQQLSKRIAGAL